MTDDVRSSGDRTPRYPGFGIPRKCVMLVMLTLMVGQFSLLQAAGADPDVMELHRLVVPFAILYGFWPEVLWFARVGDAKLAAFRSNKEVEG